MIYNKILYNYYFDVIIIGAGHAGIEAAIASSKIIKKVLILTNNIDTIGQMSCNPAIGGIGKGHLVKEIDALGGVMAIAADHSGIQFRKLNSSKGPAVQATRVQTDRIAYKNSILKIVNTYPNIFIFQQMVEDLIIEKQKIIGVITQLKLKFFSKAVILTTGTFLNGKIYTGLNSKSQGGRLGDESSTVLAKKLRSYPFRIGRLKTGTPPRIDKRTINFKKLIIQKSDIPIPFFSFLKQKKKILKQLSCYLTSTNCNTHKIILKNLHKSPIYTQIIKSIGPRYCPSIEDKIIRFKNKNSHQVFLEPESLNSNEIYPNGISTSLPFDIQAKIINSIDGLENAHLTRPGYAVEYDFFDARDLKLSLESKYISGLFFAGQINGTTGYEEAASQGLLAGINASRFCIEKEPWIPRRDQAYLGVLVDDLCTLGTDEPYRMFTSRSEYRLSLREDNADLRLTEIGRKLGIIENKRWKEYNQKIENIEKEKQKLRNTYILPNSFESEQLKKFFGIKKLTTKINGEDLLKRPEISYNKIMQIKCFLPKLKNLQEANQIEIETKYKGYIIRQKNEIKKNLENENVILPKDIIYEKIYGLSNEIILKLKKEKPNSIRQAKRISGITPASISILLIYLKKIGFLKNKIS